MTPLNFLTTQIPHRFYHTHTLPSEFRTLVRSWTHLGLFFQDSRPVSPSQSRAGRSSLWWYCCHGARSRPGSAHSCPNPGPPLHHHPEQIPHLAEERTSQSIRILATCLDHCHLQYIWLLLVSKYKRGGGQLCIVSSSEVKRAEDIGASGR